MTNYEFTIEKSRFGLYTSVDSDGNQMVTGLTPEAVDFCTRHIHLPVRDGTFDGFTSKPRSSVVEGKL